MPLFTFVMDYRGGTYVSQVRAATVTTALRQWARTINAEEAANFGERTRVELLKKVREKDDQPVSLTGLKNAWCFSALLRGHLVLVNLILTDERVTQPGGSSGRARRG